MIAFNHDLHHQDVSDDSHDPSPRHPDSRLEASWLFLYEQLPPAEWHSEDYIYKTSGWLNIHADIRNRQHTLTQISEAYQAGQLEWSAYRLQSLPRINQYMMKLHHHHNIEDQAYFPTFIRMYPQLKSGFEILDQDHVRLDALLNELQALNGQLARSESEDKALGQRLHQTLVTVSTLLSQHLTDEEDLVIPILGLN